MACGLSSCASWALEHRLSSCGTRASLLHGMWDLPGPGLEPMSPALAGGFLTTVPPGKSLSPVTFKTHVHLKSHKHIYRLFFLNHEENVFECDPLPTNSCNGDFVVHNTRKPRPVFHPTGARSSWLHTFCPWGSESTSPVHQSLHHLP